MWWFIKLKQNDNKKVIYEYGFETKKLSGIVEYDKSTQGFSVIKLADNDSISLTERFLYNHLYRAIFKENCPTEKQIVIG